MRDLAFDTAASEAGFIGPSQPPLLEAKGLSYCTGEARLIDGIDLRLPMRRTTVILGANGAGKSLLLRLLHGLVKPTGGEILWQGRVLDRAARRAQAMVFQRPVMLRRSVRANLTFALTVQGITGRVRAARAAEALRVARLEDFADRPARVLSGGEQQRLAIARALSGSPEMLFLDEPTASLDPASTQAVEDLIRLARYRGVTVVLVTHDAGQARRLGDELVFLHAGQVAETGPVPLTLDAPLSPAAQAWRDGRLYLDPPTKNL